VYLAHDFCDCCLAQEQRGLSALQPLLAYNFVTVVDTFLANAYL